MSNNTARRHRRFYGLLMVSCAIPSLALAEISAADADAPTKTARDEEVVVTAEKKVFASVKAVEAVKYGNAVQIVTADDIRASGASNMAEMAQFLVKGVNIGYSPDEGEYTIRLDGGGDRDTLVIRDGVPLYDRGPALEDIWSSTIIDPHMVERMEVFRGGNSLFYGSNGGIGVVSLVSKKPDGTRKGEFGISWGSFQSREVWGNYAFPIDEAGKHSVMAYGSMQATDGPRIYNPNDFVDNVALAGGIQDYPLNRNEIGLKYLWQIDNATALRINAEYTESWFQDAFPDREIHSPNTVRYPILDASFEKRWSPALLTEVTAYFTNPKIWNTEVYPDICKVAAGCLNPATNKMVAFGVYSGKVFPNGAYRGFGTTNQPRAGFKEMGFSVRNTINLGEYLELVAGAQTVEYQNDSAVQFPVGNATNTTTGLFVDFRPKLPFSPETAISVGARTDFLSGSDNKTIWKMAFKQPVWGGLYVRGNGGTSYSLPKVTELNNITSTSVGNPNLEPESTKTYNGAIGFNHQYNDISVSVELGAFKTEITKRIQGTTDFRIPAGNGFPARNTFFNNTALTRILGATADVDVNIGRNWHLGLGYTAQDSSLTSGLLKGEQINETPSWLVDGTMSWTSDDERLNLVVLPRIQGSEWSTGGLTNPVIGRGSIRKNFGDYTVVNATINYFMGANRQHQLQLRVVNLFDEKYAERYGFGNQLYGSAYNRGEFTTASPKYYFGYPFEGKPRSFYVSLSTKF